METKPSDAIPERLDDIRARIERALLLKIDAALEPNTNPMQHRPVPELLHDLREWTETVCNIPKRHN